jgi:tetratricopeptide (TPR) repeat protein
VLSFVFFGCSQKKAEKKTVHSTADSLSTYFLLANDLNLDIGKRQLYSRNAFEIVISQENDSLNRVNLFKVANRYYNLGNWVDYNKTVLLVLNNSEEKRDSISMAKAYTYLGDYYDSQAISDSAFMFYNKAAKLYVKTTDNIVLSKILINKANLQYKIGAFLGAQNTIFNVLRKIKGEKKANNILYDAYNLLGLIYNELGEYDNALIYSNKALLISDDRSIPEEYQSKASSFNNIGFLYLNANQYSLSKSYFQQGLDQNNLLKHKPTLFAVLSDNLAYAKFKLNETDGLPELFYSSLKLSEKLKLTSGIFVNKIHLSEYFASKKDTVSALKYSNEALLLAKSSNVSRDVLVALKQLSIIEPKKAAVYNREYIHINEELQNSERRMGDKFSRIEYETDVIKGENSDLTTQNRNLVYILSFVTILGLFIYIIKAQKTKNRVLLFII